MITPVVRFSSLVMAGLIAGIILGIWIGYNPKALTAAAYVEQQQNAIRSLNTLMPVLGLITIVLTLTSAFLQKKNTTSFILLLVAAACLVVSGLITKFGNQPINSLVITWNKDNVPANWTELRDSWWSFHIQRTLASICAFCLIAWTSISKD